MEEVIGSNPICSARSALFQLLGAVAPERTNKSLNRGVAPREGTAVCRPSGAFVVLTLRRLAWSAFINSLNGCRMTASSTSRSSIQNLLNSASFNSPRPASCARSYVPAISSSSVIACRITSAPFFRLTPEACKSALMRARSFRNSPKRA